MHTVSVCAIAVYIASFVQGGSGVWGKAHWGMSQDALMRQYPGAVKLLPRMLDQAKLYPALESIEISGVRLRVFFDFGQDDHLRAVTLEHGAPDARAAVDCGVTLLGLLTKKYGPGYKRDRLRLGSSTLTTEQWQTPDSVIDLTVRADPLVTKLNYCMVGYQARRTPEADSL